MGMKPTLRKRVRELMLGLLSVIAFFPSHAQRPDRCGSMDVLQQKFREHPALKARFEAREKQLKQMVAERIQAGTMGAFRDQALLTVPVVFHIVMSNPSQVTDAQIQAQMDTLNKDYAGINGDTVRIPSWFKSLFGVANIQFALAKQGPNGEPTTGIERYTTGHGDFSVFTNDVKHVSTGGANAWNTNNYLNVWICSISAGYLGLGTFPNDGDSANQGVMIDYRSIPGGSYTNYNGGKTLTHEAGHYFNLYHTWGDDNGACSGTDYVDDTPNQADYTSGCPGMAEKLDACSQVSPGVLYQDYMDYSYDNCLVMFTKQQAARMQAAVTLYRSSLFTSPGLQSPIVNAYDVRLKAITQPATRLCAATFAPAVTIRNVGGTTLTSLTINVAIDGIFTTAYSWTGSLTSLAEASVTLNNVTTGTGNHTLTIYTTNPNGQADQGTSNDTLSVPYMYFPPAALPLAEHFEGSSFPPDGWDIVNPDGSYTWEKTSAGKTGNAMMVKNYNYTNYGARDYLRLPLVSLNDADSAFISFQVAAATYSATGTPGNVWDTLQVLISTDCGNTYTSLYQKAGDSLKTAPSVTSYFIPTASQWRKDSVNLTPYIGQGNVMIAFLNTTENENNIYLDDINVYKKTVNPNLKAKGFIVTPNPASQSVAVQFYPQPSNLRGVELYSFTGQKVAEVIVGSGQAMNYYRFNIGHLAAGVYVVRAVFTDKVVTQKLVKIQ